MAMTRDDIIRMAREAGIPETATEGVFIANSDDLGRLIAAEREECVKLCNWLADRYPETNAVSCSEIISIRGSDGL